MLRAWTVSTHGSSPYSPLHFFASPFSTNTVTTAAASANSTAATKSNLFAMSRSIRIAVVGDVHDDWDLEEDTKALQYLQPDLVLFTGDFGNENVELVKTIADLKIPKVAILGNHDCWYTHQFSQKKADRVQLQLECLGEQHVGYRRLDFPLLKLSIVGGRPFSCGGDKLFRPKLLFARYGVNDMEGSAKHIHEAALGTPEGYSVVFLAHCGPTGLGSKENDICGRDWAGGGDHGDPDLASAISDLKTNTRFSVPLVVFGHMHKELAYRIGLRKMIVVGDDNTIYLNGAIVPRVKPFFQPGTTSRSAGDDGNQLRSPNSGRGTLRVFTLVEILDGRVEKISETWVSVMGNRTVVEDETVLFKKL